MQFSGGEHDFYGPYAAAAGKPMSITETAALWNPAPDTRASAPTELQVKSLWCARRAARPVHLCPEWLAVTWRGPCTTSIGLRAAWCVFECGLCCGARAGGSRYTTPPATPPTR
jgi:hypothetical protein